MNVAKIRFRVRAWISFAIKWTRRCRGGKKKCRAEVNIISDEMEGRQMYKELYLEIYLVS